MKFKREPQRQTSEAAIPQPLLPLLQKWQLLQLGYIRDL